MKYGPFRTRLVASATGGDPMLRWVFYGTDLKVNDLVEIRVIRAESAKQKHIRYKSMAKHRQAQRAELSK